MKSVVFLGLNSFYNSELRNEDLKKLYSEDAEIWTMNDFYVFYPLIKPDYVFQPHYNFDGKHIDPSRFTGNYLREYNKSKAGIITTSHYPELEKEEVIDMNRWQRLFGVYFFECGVNFMFAYTMDKRPDLKTIYMHNFKLANSHEHERQVPFVVNAIDETVKRGVQVICPDYAAWKKAFPRVAWECIPIGLIPYWKRDKSNPEEIKISAFVANCKINKLTIRGEK